MPAGGQISFVRASALILYCSLLFVYCLLLPNYRLLGTNYGLVGPNYRLPPPNENESRLLAVIFAFQASPFKALGVERREGEGKVGGLNVSNFDLSP